MNDPAPPPAPATPTSPTRHVVSPDGTRLAWDERGEGPPVLLVHGLGLTRARWEPQAAAIAGAGYHVVRFDLRGLGDSDEVREGYPMERLVDDLEAIVRATIPEAPTSGFHLVGHSLGGCVCQTFAVRHPGWLRSLSLISTTPHNGRRASIFAHGMAEISAAGPDAATHDPEVRARIESVLADAFGDSAPPVEFLVKGLKGPSPGQAFGWTTMAGFSVKDELDSVTCPALVVHGSFDQVIPFSVGNALQERLARSTWVPMEGASHVIPIERPDELNRVLLDFLGALPDAPRSVSPGSGAPGSSP